MKRSTTIILLALTVALGAWMLLRNDAPRDLAGHFLFDWSANVTTKEEIRVDVDAAEVAGIDLKNSATEISLRKREDGSWEASKGVKDRADVSLVKQLLEYCRTARITDIIDGDEVDDGSVSAASLGLDDANAWQITWLRADGSRLAEIRAGLSAPGSDTGYVRMTGQARRPDVYLVRPDLRPLLARPLDSFRDPRVSRYSAEQVIRMVVRKGEGEVEFSRASVKEEDGAPWVISRPLPNAPADQAAVKEFVAVICGATIKGWATYTDAAGIGEGGDKPVVEVTLVPPGANEKGSTLSFFKDPEAPEKTAICRDVQRKASFKVDKQIMDDLCLAESPNDFRSRKLAVVDPGVISTVEITTVFGESVTVVRVGDKWWYRPLAGGAWSVAAPEQLEKLISRLNSTEILDFASDSLADPAAFGLDKPAMTITLAAGAHLSLDLLTPMTDRNKQTLRIGIRDTGDATDGQIFANFAGDPFVYRIDPKLPEAIPQAAIKWRSLTLPGFSILQVRALKQAVGAAPPLELRYDPKSLQWSASRSGEDFTARLNKAAAEALAVRLGALTITAWLEETANATKALENPTASVEVQYEVFDEKPAASHLATALLELATIPTAQNARFCYGRLSGVPTPFVIDSSVLREVSVDLLQK